MSHARRLGRKVHFGACDDFSLRIPYRALHAGLELRKRSSRQERQAETGEKKHAKNAAATGHRQPPKASRLIDPQHQVTGKLGAAQTRYLGRRVAMRLSRNAHVSKVCPRGRASVNPTSRLRHVVHAEAWIGIASRARHRGITLVGSPVPNLAGTM